MTGNKNSNKEMSGYLPERKKEREKSERKKKKVKEERGEKMKKN